MVLLPERAKFACCRFLRSISDMQRFCYVPVCPVSFEKVLGADLVLIAVFVY